MNGAVGVSSKPGAGSRFWVRFPTSQPKSDAAIAAVDPSMGKRVRASTGAFAQIDLPAVSGEFPAPVSDIDVLVVDDLAEMRGLVARVLEKHGFTTYGAASGEEALILSPHLHPRLILSDWMMPNMSGPELIAAIRRDEELASTPVVLLTAKSDEHSRIVGTSAGADGFIGKPFNATELVSVVRNLIQLKDRERQIERLNEDLVRERDALDRLQQRKAELTRFIVHDLKNPLTVATAGLDFVISEEELASETRATLQAALHATETATRMVLDLLDVERSHDTELVARDLGDLPGDQLLAEVGERVVKWLAIEKIELDTSADPVVLRADRDLVIRTLVNLIENAAKYGPKPGVIKLSVTAEGDSAVLRVADQGPGIPAAERERIFEKYHRLDEHRATESRSSRGLGLVFCRVATEAQGGSIWVEDSDPSGCCFCVRLPRAVQVARRDAASGA
jgi:signal transduction histidine kinase